MNVVIKFVITFALMLGAYMFISAMETKVNRPAYVTGGAF